MSIVTTFRAVEKIPDSEAVNDDDVVRMLSDLFSSPKPSWRLYMENNETKQQKNEPTIRLFVGNLLTRRTCCLECFITK